MRRALCGLLALLAMLGPLWAQQAEGPAMLVADEVRLTGDDRLVAEGNVEAMYQGRRLTAEQIVYERGSDRLSITGPLSLTEPGPDGGTVLIADSAEIDRDLRNGILRGARVVMQQQLQLAASRLRRTDARYNELSRVSVTSCRICEEGGAPLWQIRAERLVHDQQERQLNFENAQVRVLDVPVFYLPRLRLPDPTVERATGFLAPSVVNSSLLGTGVVAPYFIRIDDHRDLTLAPFWATNSRRLGFRYRQAFRRGEVEFNGAIADDDFSPDARRGYLFGEGRFDLPRDFNLRFNIELTSDDTFLLDHGFSDKDRLSSGVAIYRARRDEFISGEITHYRSLREGESNSTLPSIIGDAEYERRFFPARVGGELRFSSALHSHYRRSDRVTDGPDLDRFADGRDVTRFTTGLEWQRDWLLPAGVLGEIRTGLTVDHFRIRQIGETAQSQATELTPTVAAQLRWPLIRAGRSGVAHVIEPVAQLAWAGGSNPDVPQDESTVVEFDEGNLFNVSRFNAPDRRERGAAAAYGLSYERIDPEGWETRLALGQVWRDDRLLDSDGTRSFTRSSGLRNRSSDLLVAGQYRSATGLTVTARGLFDGVMDVTKAEARASWINDRTDIGATYIWLSDDPRERRAATVSEWAIDGSYRVARHWTARGEWRYDAETDNSIRAGAGLTYTNECVDITVSVSRRFTSSTILEPETNIGFTVGLRGFSAATRDESYTRTCRN
jgi:LPS-assembly protein